MRLVLVLAVSLVSCPLARGDEPTPPYFTNVTDEAGLTGVQAFRIAVGDLDGDGYADILVHTAPDQGTGDVLDKQFLYLNEASGGDGTTLARTFVDHTAGSGIRDNRQGTTDGRHSDAAIFADVDNDGDLDIFTSVYLHRNYTLALGTNDLLINDGTAHFALASNSPFHLEENWNTPAATFLDYDNDGNIDLFIGTWYKPDSTLNIDHLYQGHGDGSFTNVTTAAGLNGATTCIYGVATFDWNDDGYMDLFAPPYSHTVQGSTPIHWQNNGNGTFTQVQGATGYDEYRGWHEDLFRKSGVASFGTMPRDFDNDGDMDFLEILTHGRNEDSCEWIHNGLFWEVDAHTTPVQNVDDVFEWDCDAFQGRSTEDTDMTHHGDHYASWFDFDGDMLVDVIFTESGYSNPGLYLLRQQADHTFVPVTTVSGLWEINEGGLSPGYVTPVDYDRDGDEDLLVTTDTGLRLYRNDAGTDHAWIALKLEGAGGDGYVNRSAIGARVEVTAGGVTQTQEVHAGNGHEGPMRPLTLHFGLGHATVIDAIWIRWPSQTLPVQEMYDVAVNQYLAVPEPCDYASAPGGLSPAKEGEDLVLTWDDTAEPGVTFNVYRETVPDTSTWSEPHEEGVTDEDLSTPGIQYHDTGAVVTPDSYFYLITAVNECGETDLR